jgi:hypothetical protein
MNIQLIAHSDDGPAGIGNPPISPITSDQS